MSASARDELQALVFDRAGAPSAWRLLEQRVAAARAQSPATVATWDRDYEHAVSVIGEARIRCGYPLEDVVGALAGVRDAMTMVEAHLAAGATAQ